MASKGASDVEEEVRFGRPGRRAEAATVHGGVQDRGRADGSGRPQRQLRVPTTGLVERASAVSLEAESAGAWRKDGCRARDEGSRAGSRTPASRAGA